ncbi:ATP-binding protein (plasmid) [Ensifer adhaerens]|uniref:ATP-binding protein n=1 Tax=Ensifer adhaerens TaxID=106592 RepID=UPI0021018D48|nr:ATP-binding protein [Ensifer adhaerens]UTV41748.1 ATP-binding protein [Ensifer adhaerens]
MADTLTGSIATLFSTPGRFLRSVQLEKDFLDEKALEGYFVTPPMSQALRRIFDSLRQGSRRRAWRVTGDYGVGKSTMALVLARLLSDPTGEDSVRIRQQLGYPAPPSDKPLLSVLITGSRENIAGAVARGIRECLSAGPAHEITNARLEAALVACETEGTARSLEHLLNQVCKCAATIDHGVLLIIDELGKLLEYAAINPDHEDVFALQRLAELASRSGDHPLLLVGVLHQGFQAYAERLPASLRHEWDKVAGRFEEIVFDQPLVHTAALAAGALGIDVKRLPTELVKQARMAVGDAERIGWIAAKTFDVDPAALYPLHPAVLPAMVRFFAQFGQSERSLFGFLLSSEPMALQSFAEARPVGTAWFDLADFYSYVRTSFGHRLSSPNVQSSWLRIVATIDGLADATATEVKVLKAVGLLNLLDADDLVPTRRSLAAALVLDGAQSLGAVVDHLVARGVLFERRDGGALRLWPSLSVNLPAAVEAAKRAVGTIETVAPALAKLIEPEMVLARRHYLETGTMRYFELRYALGGDFAKAVARPTQADGLIILVLADRKEQLHALRKQMMENAPDDPALLIGLLPPLWHLSAYLQDLMIWQWVEANTPDLASDDFAAAEVHRQVARARQALMTRFSMLTAENAAGPLRWLHLGKELAVEVHPAKIVSDLCANLYPFAPRVTNELVNRNVLSSAAASARMRLIEGMFNWPDKANLGIDEKKSPPEKSMYLSVLKRGSLHVSDGDDYHLQIPSGDADKLHLQPSLTFILQQVRDARGCRVEISALLEQLGRRPYGVREGLAPILLALVLKLHGHELALYENGTFLPKCGSMEFLRLIKAPKTFEIQHCSVEGVRSEVFDRLAKLFANGVQGREPVLLDVVTELCQFAAKLPDYTRKAKALSPTTLAVRDALLSAREPATLLFTELPQACGLPGFNEESGGAHVGEFMARFTDAVQELQNTYGELIKRIIHSTSSAIGQDPRQFDRVAIASRGARVSLAAREPRLRAFALRLRDPALNEQAWAESLASFVVAKPPARWLPGDEARFTEEIGALAEIFDKVESTIFSTSEDRPDVDAIRLNLTRGDGRDLVKVLHPVALDRADQDALDALEKRLPQGETQRVQILANLLWQELEKIKDTASQKAAEQDHSRGKIPT